jgi:hypothetical protein
MPSRGSQLDLLVDASPSGAVADGTVERLTQRWQERCSGEAAAASAASNAVLAKFAADAAAQRCVLRSGAAGVADAALLRSAADEDAAAARRARLAEVRRRSCLPPVRHASWWSLTPLRRMRKTSAP